MTLTTKTQYIHSPVAFYETFLSKGLRPDGRAPLEVRPSNLEKGSLTKTVSSATLQLGQSLVVCGIKAEISVPPPTEPGLGWLVENVDLCPMADPTVRPGPPPPVAQTLSQTLQNLLLRHMDLGSLCIEAGRAVWVLYIDILILSNGGNLLDVCVMALNGALDEVCLPPMTLSSTDQQEEDSEGGISRLRASGEPVLLFPKSPLPRAVTFVQIQKTWVIDPTESEESLASASVTLLLCQRDSQQKLEGVQLKGGPVSFEELESLMDAVQCRA